MTSKHKSLPFHLLVMVILPVISLYAHNIEQVAFASTLRAYIIFLVVAIFGFLIVFSMVRNLQQAAVVTTYGLVLFYSVIPLQTFLIEAGLYGISRIRYLLPMLVLIFALGTWAAIKKVRDPKQISKTLNLIVLSTLVLPMFQIGSYLVGSIPASGMGGKSLLKLEPNVAYAKGTRELPDIYLIVLDGHGRSDTIRREFGYDNTSTLDQLTRLGFYIAQCSNANYPDATWQSMFATLNMRYFDHEKIKVETPLRTINNGYENIKSSEVRSVLHSYGYKLVGFNTMYEFLNFTDADIYYDLVHFPGTDIHSFNKFESQLIGQTPIGSVLKNAISAARVHYENVQHVLTKLPQIPTEVTSPKFIYAHIMTPHAPYVFSSTGEYLTMDQQEFTGKGYVNQIGYIDSQIVDVVQAIIENSNTPPIIIIQGDHGFPSSSSQSDALGSSTAILNAYYLPGADYSGNLYPTISPINSFRLIFNLYFDKNMDLLPDHIYRDNLDSDSEHKNKGIPYEFSRFIPVSNCSYGE